MARHTSPRIELQGRQVLHRRARARGGLHRRSPEGMGRQAGRRRRHLFPDGEGRSASTSRATRASRSTVNGQTKTFKDGEGVTFPKNQGGKQTISGDRGVRRLRPEPPRAEHRRLQGHATSRARSSIYVGAAGRRHCRRRRRALLGARAGMRSSCSTRSPRSVRRRFGFGRGGADAAAAPAPAPGGPRPRPAGALRRRQRRAAQPRSRRRRTRRARTRHLGDFQTVQRLDNTMPPQITASDEFFEFIFSAAGQKLRRHQGEGRQAGAAARTSRSRTSRSRSTSTPTTTSSRRVSRATSSASSRAAIRS